MELALNRESIGHEVILLEAASETALRKTHRRYFQNVHEIGESLESPASDAERAAAAGPRGFGG